MTKIGEGLRIDERETLISMSASDRDHWYIRTDDPVMVRKLNDIAEVIKEGSGWREYKLESDQIRICKHMKLSDKERKRRSVRAKRNLTDSNE